MKLLVLAFLFLPFLGHSQDTIIVRDTVRFDESKIVDFPEKEASYPGGMAEMMRFINQNIVYPQGIYEIDPPNKIFVSFIIDETGAIHNITIRKNGWKEAEKAILDMVTKMPNWIPAEHLGKKVATKIRFPIIIELY